MTFIWQKNKKLFIFSITLLIQILLSILIWLLSDKIYFYYANIKNMSDFSNSINTNKKIIDFLYASGKSSYIWQTISQIVNLNTYSTYIKNLIIAFFQNLHVDEIAKNNNNNVVNAIDNIKNNFYYFNVFLQIYVFVFISFILNLIINVYLFIHLFIKAFMTKNSYELSKFFNIFIFNIFGFILIYFLDKWYLKNKPIIFIKKSEILKNLWIFKIINIIQNRYKKIQYSENKELIIAKNLSFSYNFKHNLFKHLLDWYKLLKFQQEIDEEGHIFALKNCFFYKHKPKNFVFQNLNFSIKKKSFTVIIGPNGCGKSTLLKTLIDVNENFYGKIYWNSQSIKDINKKNFYKQIAYIPQELNLPSEINIYDFISFSRICHQKIYKQETNADVLAILNALKDSNAYEFGSKTFDELSGGQKQKVIFAGIIAKHADTIVLDEPTVFFDLKNQIKFLNSLKTMNKQGKTIIMILHDIQQAINYASDLIVLKNGKIYAQGQPKQIINNQLLRDVFEIECDLLFNELNELKIENIKPLNVHN